MGSGLFWFGSIGAGGQLIFGGKKGSVSIDSAPGFGMISIEIMMIMIMAMIIMRNDEKGVLIREAGSLRRWCGGERLVDGALTWRITPTKVDL